MWSNFLSLLSSSYHHDVVVRRRRSVEKKKIFLFVVIVICIFNFTADALVHFEIRPTPTAASVNVILSSANNQTAAKFFSLLSPPPLPVLFRHPRFRRQQEFENSDAVDDSSSSSSCTYISCCAHFQQCAPRNCYITDRACHELLQQGALVNLGQPGIAAEAFAPVTATVGNIRLIDAAQRRTTFLHKDDETNTAITGQFVSKFGTIILSPDNNNSPPKTIVIANEPHLITSITLYETINNPKPIVITHRPVVPDFEALRTRLACGGPVTLLEQVGEQLPYTTVWTTIRPILTKTVAGDECTKFQVATNLYENVENFFTMPPAGGSGGRNCGKLWFNRCKHDAECCSGLWCDTNKGLWEFGVCKPLQKSS